MPAFQPALHCGGIAGSLRWRSGREAHAGFPAGTPLRRASSRATCRGVRPHAGFPAGTPLRRRNLAHDGARLHVSCRLSSRHSIAASRGSVGPAGWLRPAHAGFPAGTPLRLSDPLGDRHHRVSAHAGFPAGTPLRLHQSGKSVEVIQAHAGFPAGTPLRQHQLVVIGGSERRSCRLSSRHSIAAPSARCGSARQPYSCRLSSRHSIAAAALPYGVLGHCDSCRLSSRHSIAAPCRRVSRGGGSTHSCRLSSRHSIAAASTAAGSTSPASAHAGFPAGTPLRRGYGDRMTTTDQPHAGFPAGTPL